MLPSILRRSRISHSHNNLSRRASAIAQPHRHSSCKIRRRSLPRPYDASHHFLRPFSTYSPLFTKKHLTDGPPLVPPLVLGTGKLAQLTQASVVAAMGDTVVLTTLATGENPNSPFNFTVDYRQRHHGVGKIPLTTASRKDNARSTTLETLGSRAIDRALRPLIVPVHNDRPNQAIHIHSSVQGFSPKGGNPIVASINAASAMLSSQGWLQEPVAAVSLAVVAGGREPRVLVNPSTRTTTTSTTTLWVCELLYAGTRTHAVMAEFQYHPTTTTTTTTTTTASDAPSLPTSIPDYELAQLMQLAHAAIQPMLDTQAEFIRQNESARNGSNTTVEKDLSWQEQQEENEWRASVGLPSLSEDDNAAKKDAGDTLKQKADELFEQATAFCESRLEKATLALFGYTHQEEKKHQTPTNDHSKYQTAYIHPQEEAANLISKATRGRREQIVQNEIKRLLHDWIAQQQQQQQHTQSTDDNPETLATILTTMVHKELLQRALCKTAILYGTRADQRMGPHPTRTIRPISITVPALPEVVHGSAIFARGETQVLCTVTLGAPREGIPIRDPYEQQQQQQQVSSSSSPTSTNGSTQGDENEAISSSSSSSSFEDLPVGSLRYLRTQEALESDLNTRKSKADRERTGDSGSLWENRRAFLQYDFPSYSTGELPTGNSLHHNRRAIGHGALAEKAILPVLPSAHDFPYVLRITSEVTDSNGSSSMASVCGASLALMDAGVPIDTPVAGVSVGLALQDQNDDAAGGNDDNRPYELLLDITGTEDYYGAMDFKIAGTYVGVTALQLDVKKPIPLAVLPEALELAKSGRQAMLKEMTKQCNDTVLQGLKHRSHLKDTAPRVEVVRFDPQRKRDLIGPGGAVLRQLEDRYDVSVDLTQEGQCLLFGSDKDKVQKAKSAVADLVADVIEGEVYEGTVVEIKDFGAIVELLRNKEGLLHVSELADNISDPQGNLGAVKKHLKVGDKIKVLCTGVDPLHGSIRLSVKALHKRQSKPCPTPTFQ